MKALATGLTVWSDSTNWLQQIKKSHVNWTAESSTCFAFILFNYIFYETGTWKYKVESSTDTFLNSCIFGFVIINIVTHT